MEDRKGRVILIGDNIIVEENDKAITVSMECQDCLITSVHVLVKDQMLESQLKAVEKLLDVLTNVN